MKTLKNALLKLFEAANDLTQVQLITAAKNELGTGAGKVICDVGCGEGRLTRRIHEAIPQAKITCVEGYEPYMELARSRGFDVVAADLNAPLPLEDEQFDLVVCSQVIEHLFLTDLCLEELFRIVKPEGSVLIATENAASWHNIGALVLGWQPFSQTNISIKEAGVGNPLAFHAGEEGYPLGMLHCRVMALDALKHLCVAHGFKIERSYGSGYYPLPARVGAWDPRHSHFILVHLRKPRVTPKKDLAKSTLVFRPPDATATR